MILAKIMIPRENPTFQRLSHQPQQLSLDLRRKGDESAHDWRTFAPLHFSSVVQIVVDPSHLSSMEVAQSPANSTDNLWPLDRTSIWKPLDKEKREIRILLVQPSEEEDDALYADLEIVSLDSEPEYKAISYVWGDASDTTVMFVNGGKVIEITRSLAAALRRFRDSKVFVALWADAVCINQADLQERADQVRIMGKIYASAIQVNVWLGRVSDRGWHDALHGYLEVEDQPRTEGILQANEGFFEYSFSEVHEDLDIGGIPVNSRST
ncbi:hypothetical protein KC330_g5705 [Hortaea werneckii]|nr:hypothetical protein KC330_g5705 [Hortaea werneckii]